MNEELKLVVPEKCMSPNCSCIASCLYEDMRKAPKDGMVVVAGPAHPDILQELKALRDSVAGTLAYNKNRDTYSPDDEAFRKGCVHVGEQTLSRVDALIKGVE